MISVKLLNDQIKQVSLHNSALDMLLNFEKVLDDIDLYVYKNWINGEVLAGPKISRYWVTVKLMYPYKKMPDPDGAKRLLARKCLVKFSKDKLSSPVPLRGPADLEMETLANGTTRFKTKTKTEPVWVVEIKMPRRYVDEFDKSVIVNDDEFIDMETISSGKNSNVGGKNGINV